jgi:hypothetical protein
MRRRRHHCKGVKQLKCSGERWAKCGISRQILFLCAGHQVGAHDGVCNCKHTQCARLAGAQVAYTPVALHTTDFSLEKGVLQDHAVKGYSLEGLLPGLKLLPHMCPHTQALWTQPLAAHGLQPTEKPDPHASASRPSCMSPMQ